MQVKSIVVDITPTVASFTIRCRTEKVAPHPAYTLEANILILSTGDYTELTVINVDTVFSSTYLESRIREYVDSHATELLIVATHTHNAPVLDPTFLDGTIFDEDVVDTVARQIAEAIKELQMIPFASVSLATGHSDAPGSVYRRKNTWTFMGKCWPPFRKTCSMVANRRQPIPTQLSVIAARNSSGELQFLIWTWPCHATSISDQHTLGADFPGSVRQILRNEMGEGVRIPIVYLPGLCGDIRPDSSSYFSFDGERIYRPFARQFIFRSTEWAQHFTRRIADSALLALGQASETATTDHCTIRKCEMDVNDIFDGQTDASLRMTRLTNGELDILLFSAEVCSSYHALIKELVTSKTLCTGLTGQIYGYLPTDEQIKHGGYEVSQFMEAFELKGEYHAATQDKVLVKVRELYPRDEPGLPD